MWPYETINLTIGESCRITRCDCLNLRVALDDKGFYRQKAGGSKIRTLGLYSGHSDRIHSHKYLFIAKEPAAVDNI